MLEKVTGFKGFWRGYILVCLMAGCVPKPSVAQEWQLFPLLSLSGEYETNPTQSADNEVPNSVYRVNPSLISALEFPSSSLEIDASADLSRSQDQTVEADADQFEVSVSGDKSFNRSTVSAGVQVAFEEFANSDFDDEQALSSVNIASANEDDTILTARLNMGLSYEIDSTVSSQLGSEFTSTEFSDETRTSSIEYGLSNEFAYALTDVLSATNRASVELFEPEDGDQVLTLRLSGGMNYVIDEDHSINGSLGIVSNDVETSFTVNWSQIQSFKYFDVTSSSVFDLEPDENGEFQRTSTSTISVSRPFSELVTGRIGAGYAESGDSTTIETNSSVQYIISNEMSSSFAISFRQTEDDEGGGDSDSTTTNIVLTPTFSITITEEMSALLRYDEIYESEQEGDLVNSRRGTLTLSYNFNPI